jgi:hypothetical protein
MLSTEDLVDLGEGLRASGFKLAAYQYFSAQQVLLHAAAAGISDRRRLTTLLGPVFCTNSAEQRRFAELFDVWLSRRFPGIHPETEKTRVPAPPAPKLGRSHPHWKIVIAAGALVLALTVVWAFWQMQQPLEIRGVVVEAGTGQPIAGAFIDLRKGKVSTDKDGRFQIPTTAHSLPMGLIVSMKGFVPNATEVGEGYKELRQHLYLWPRLPELGNIKVELTAVPPAGPAVTIELPPTTGSEPARIGEPRQVDLNKILPPVNIWQRLIWSDVGWISLPLALFALWQLWSWMRRPALQRASSRTPNTIKEVHLPGGLSTPTAALPLRRLAQELRRRRAANSDELQVQATIEASLHNAGIFTPVRGSRVEPDYIALVDVASQSDHRARLEDELLRHLLRSDVLIERYVFQGDPTLCTHVSSVTLATALAGKSPMRRLSEAHVVHLEELQLRCPEHRLLVFSDGAQLFDAFSGVLTPAAEILLRWSMPTLLTSKPLEQWGEIEWALDRRGFTVLPISRAGLTALMSTSIGAIPLKPGAATTQSL